MIQKILSIEQALCGDKMKNHYISARKQRVRSGSGNEFVIIDLKSMYRCEAVR